MDPVSNEARLTPAARRRKLLRRYGLEESFLTYLRELPIADARWVIAQERKRAEEFTTERFTFIITDCITRRPEPKRRRGAAAKPTDPLIILPIDSRSGDKLA